MKSSNDIMTVVELIVQQPRSFGYSDSRFHEAEAKSIAADQAKDIKNTELALVLNYEAAEGFASVSTDVPSSHPNTRSDLAILAVASFVRGERYDRAVEFAQFMLSQPDSLSPRGRGELLKMIAECESIVLKPCRLLDRNSLREATSVVRPQHSSDRWMLQTSNSFRRIGSSTRGDGDVLHATTHPYDGHPDLQAAPGVLDYIVAAQPSVVLALLEDLDAAEDKLRQTRDLLAKISAIEKRIDNDLAGLCDAHGRALAEVRSCLGTLRAALGVSPISQGVADRGQGVADRGQGVADRGQGVADRGQGVADRGQGVADRGQGIADRS
jgi:hypothetical protein